MNKPPTSKQLPTLCINPKDKVELYKMLVEEIYEGLNIPSLLNNPK